MISLLAAESTKGVEYIIAIIALLLYPFLLAVLRLLKTYPEDDHQEK